MIKSKYPFDTLQVGDCFTIPIKKGVKAVNKRTSIIGIATSWAAKNKNDMEFTTNIIEENKKKHIKVTRVK